MPEDQYGYMDPPSGGPRYAPRPANREQLMKIVLLQRQLHFTGAGESLGFIAKAVGRPISELPKLYEKDVTLVLEALRREIRRLR